MKKIILFVALLGCMASAVFAQQNHVSGHQLVSVRLHNIMEFAFTSTNNSNGGTVLLPFTTLSDYAHGVSSPEQVLRVRSNKKFEIAVKASSPYFDYKGEVVPAPNMPVDSVLDMQVASNSTGGSLMPPFGKGRYVSLSANSVNILSNCGYGGDQQFSIKYKAAPGINYPIGTYTVDIIYTATQQ